ncbi:ABC transporter permease [Legionella bononiensis]|uniref:ABC transporter permease n=1 Tax=Legionella bononiensis TaxID=2793102 RepID=A0ABS1WCK9_9GAMM|nr:ABC transporter permease [Legionella bononiensis]MBL7478955.1 ABC transporter permease [Legionella bononiensis]MBL7527087.1 ABC transporter permease [Legionella bononiensis]MBL7562056.1 ABC transporter permease [Legionella bononiensis]
MSASDMNTTTLSKQEKNWIQEQRITRISDQKEVLIYPMGAERYLFSVLSGENKHRYNIKADIENKNILIIPGYGNSSFIFAQAGANSITVYDKDPVTIAWMKAYKKYYHYREYDEAGNPYPSVGELLTALTCWYPPLLKLPTGQITHRILWLFNPRWLRRNYIFYILSLVRNAIQNKDKKHYEFEKNICFYAGELKHLMHNKNKPVFDTAFVPYLLGVTNGIEKKEEIVEFITQLMQLVPSGHVLVSPTQKNKEFYILGQTYFVTTDYPTLASIPGLESLVINEDKEWFKTQGLTIFASEGKSR